MHGGESGETMLELKDPGRPALDARDQRWIDRAAAVYAPPRRTPDQRAALRVRLERRIAQRQRPLRRTSVWAAALLGAVVLQGRPLERAQHLAPEQPFAVAAGELPALPSWEERLLDSDAAISNLERDERLPPGYDAIAQLFLEG
jgi:hypothetical protein